MAVKASGQLAFSEIGEEFGLAPNPNGSGYSLGAYRVSQTVSVLSNLGLDNNQNNPPTSIMPQGNSTIRISDFYSKKLNTIVDLHSSDQNNTTRKDIRARYDSNNVTVIGGFRSRPTDTGEKPPTGVRGKRVIGLINVTIGSEQSSNASRCAVQTGDWDSNTTFEVHVGDDGEIIGAGGDGGNAGGCGNGNAPAQSSNGATSGLGVEYNGTKVINNGYIQCGYGGGGGGGTASCDPNKSMTDPIAPGAGGGGGAGFPAGSGGDGGCDGGGCADDGGDGANKTRGGGGGGLTDGCATGGDGGNGGQPGGGANDPQAGGNGNDTYGSACERIGGSAGASGDAIRCTMASGNVTIVNAGTIHGDTEFSVTVT